MDSSTDDDNVTCYICIKLVSVSEPDELFGPIIKISKGIET